MVRRCKSLSPLAMLALLTVAMLMVRVVDLHWHQHLNSALTMADGSVMPITYVADASTPHLADDQDHDVRMFGDEGGVSPLPHLPAGLVAIVATLPLLLLTLARPSPVRPRPEPRSCARRFRSPQLPPPLRGPPR